MSVNKKKENISRMILNYLQKNPDAGDTLEGISKWWLEIERTDVSVDEVAKVLEDLVQKGLIRMCEVKNATIFYKINKKA